MGQPIPGVNQGTTELPRRGGTLGIEIFPFSYQLPAEKDVVWVNGQIKSALQALKRGEIKQAQEKVDQLGIVPGNLLSFQEKFPKQWKQLRQLILEIARFEHQNPPDGKSNVTPFYAPQAKHFLKQWIVVEEQNRAFTYRKETLQRGPHPDTGYISLCNPHFVQYKNKYHYQNHFDPELIEQELIEQLKRDLQNIPGELPCYTVVDPVLDYIEVDGHDNEVGEQEPIPLRASVSVSGYALQDVTWKQRFGPPMQLMRSNDVWYFKTPQVLGDNLKIGFTVIAQNILGKKAEDDVIITVLNSINENPRARIKGPRKVYSGDKVTLRGKGTDPNPADRSKLNFLWKRLRGPEVSFSTENHHLTFVAPKVDKPQRITFSLTVSDPQGGQGVGKRRIVILPRPEPIAEPKTPPKKEPAVAKAPELKNDGPQIFSTIPSHRPKRLKKLRGLSNLGPIHELPSIPGKDAGLANLIKQIIHEEKPVPRQEVCLVADRSGSMKDDIKRLGREFNQIQAELAASGPSSNLCLVTFVDDKIEIAWKLNPKRTTEEDVSGVRKKLSNLEYKGQFEYLAEAGKLAVDEMQRNGDPTTPKRRIIVITDEKGDFKENGETLASVRQKAKNINASFHVIWISRPRKVYFRPIVAFNDYLMASRVPYASLSGTKRGEFLIKLLHDESVKKGVHAEALSRLGDLALEFPAFRQPALEIATRYLNEGRRYQFQVRSAFKVISLFGGTAYSAGVESYLRHNTHVTKLLRILAENNGLRFLLKAVTFQYGVDKVTPAAEILIEMGRQREALQALQSREKMLLASDPFLIHRINRTKNLLQGNTKKSTVSSSSKREIPGLLQIITLFKDQVGSNDSSSSFFTLRNAIEKLGRFGGVGFGPFLVPLLYHPNKNIVRTTVEAMGNLEFRPVVPKLLQLQGDDSLIGTLIETFGKMKDRRAQGRLEYWLMNHKNCALRYKAAEALQKIGIKVKQSQLIQAFVPPLEQPALYDNHFMAAEGLKKFRVSGALPQVEKILTTLSDSLAPDPVLKKSLLEKVLYRLIEFVGDFGTNKHIPLLAKYLDHTAPHFSNLTTSGRHRTVDHARNAIREIEDREELKKYDNEGT